MSWWLPSWLTGGIDLSAEEARARELDTKTQALNAAALDRGIWTEDQYYQAEANRAQNAAEIPQYYAEVYDAAKVGAIEGLGGMADGVRNSVNAVAGGGLGFIWRAVPWWVWILGGLYLAFQLGLLGPLVAMVRRK